jgi:uncharacterized membrane protein
MTTLVWTCHVSDVAAEQRRCTKNATEVTITTCGRCARAPHSCCQETADERKPRMGKIKKSVDINASGDEVFTLLTDLDTLPTWSTITLETHGTPRKPIAEGDTFTQTLRVLGHSLEAQWRVVELSKDRKLAYETSVPGGGRMEMSQTISDSDGVSRVEFEVDYDLPEDVAAVLEGGVAERRNERELDHSLQNLKDLAESRSGR